MSPTPRYTPRPVPWRRHPLPTRPVQHFADCLDVLHVVLASAPRFDVLLDDDAGRCLVPADPRRCADARQRGAFRDAVFQQIAIGTGGTLIHHHNSESNSELEL